MTAEGAVQSVDLGVTRPGQFLVIPWSDSAPEVEIQFDGLAADPTVRRFRLATTGIDRWRYIPVDGKQARCLRISAVSTAIGKARLVDYPPTLRTTVHGVVLPFGSRFELIGIDRGDAGLQLELACDLVGAGDRTDIIRLTSIDGLDWSLDDAVIGASDHRIHDPQLLPATPAADGTLVCLLGTAAAVPIESLRVWERSLEIDDEQRMDVPLRFRAMPGVWPDIRLGNAEGTISDVTAAAHELRLEFDPGTDGTTAIDIAGFRVSTAGRTVAAGGDSFEVAGSGPLRLVLSLEGQYGVLAVNDGGPLFLPQSDPPGAVPVGIASANIEGFSLTASRPTGGTIRFDSAVRFVSARIYGLRVPLSAAYRDATWRIASSDSVFYSGDRFSVRDQTVREHSLSDLPAIVPDRQTIVSPQRVIEEFAWRDNELGDMTRVVDRVELWRSVVEPGRFPEFSSAFRSLDAAFQLALETFQRNASEEFALPGQVGMWSAGYFQGPGSGFGVWKRDTSHIAIRSGNLLDPAAARSSLAHVVNSGFDNGSDGDALPAVAIWDYYLATGDVSLIHETWPALARIATALDSRFDDERGLVDAPQSTSNDLFDEPEADGFALSTEIYSMQSYAALARMATLPGIGDGRSGAWAERAEAMRRRIIDQYWNPVHGFFTSGPAGSESYEEGYWETSGSEAALWGFLGETAESKTKSVLKRMHSVAMSDFGVILFPYRQPDNHFCGTVWYCWQAGIARAAARVGDAALVHQLIGQQARTIVRNKTFYEVTEADSGHSWRWPGQLWHAAGFVSLIVYGLLGIRYDLDGMTFTPAVVPEFEGASLRGLRYRDAQLDIEIRGHGTRCDLLLDGVAVDRIPTGVTGRHSVVLAMR